MSYSEEVKQLAYKMDPECWVSYSGCTKVHKRAMDTRRELTLKGAKQYVDNRELAKAVHRLEETLEEATEPKKYMLRGRELKEGDGVVYLGKKSTVRGTTDDVVWIVVDAWPSLVLAMPLSALGAYLSWPPVKQKAPTRAHVSKTGISGWVTIPEKIGFSGLSNLSLEFATRKDADEFYEVFNRLNSEKKA